MSNLFAEDCLLENQPGRQIDVVPGKVATASLYTVTIDPRVAIIAPRQELHGPSENIANGRKVWDHARASEKGRYYIQETSTTMDVDHDCNPKNDKSVYPKQFSREK